MASHLVRAQSICKDTRIICSSHTQAHTHSLSLSLTHAHTLSLSYTHTRTHTHTHTLSLSYTRARAHTLQVHALLVLGWYNEKKTTDQVEDEIEKRSVLSTTSTRRSLCEAAWCWHPSWWVVSLSSSSGTLSGGGEQFINCIQSNGNAQLQ